MTFSTCLRVVYFLPLLPLITACTQELAQDGSGSESEVLLALRQQVEAWNRGDISAFMESYVETDELRFSSGGTVQRGYQETLERYERRFFNREAMGHLDFEELEVLFLSGDWAEVHGRYRLKRGGAYPDATGLFTLLMKKTGAGWKILHDHTSTDN